MDYSISALSPITPSSHKPQTPTKPRKERSCSPSSPLQRTTLLKAVRSTCKRRRDGTLVASSWPLLLGYLEVEAYALRPAHGLLSGLPITFKFAEPVQSIPEVKKQKKKAKPDHTIRFTIPTVPDLSLGRLPVRVSSYLHPLVTHELVTIQGELVENITQLKVLDPVKVKVEVGLCETAVSGKVAENTVNEMLGLFKALGFEKIGTKMSHEHSNALEKIDDFLEYQEDYILEEAMLPSDFPVSLYPHQKQALSWMLEREGKGPISPKTQDLHPLWDEYRLGGTQLYHNIHSGEIALECPHLQETCQGGILADEMGLGKTITLLALVYLQTTKGGWKRRKGGEDVKGNTLIVVPLAMLEYWKNEIQGNFPMLKYTCYYGPLRKLKGSSAVTLTTYGTVASEYSTSGPLFTSSWFRLVLDEGHIIRNGQSYTSKACFRLHADYKWVLTGTPVHNSLEDLSSLVHLLAGDQYNIASLVQKKELSVVRKLLKPILLRRTKLSEISPGRLLIPLPSLRIETRVIEFTPWERSQYLKLQNSCHAAFQAMENAGVLKRSMGSLFEMTLRMRQFCDHYALLQGNSATIQRIESFVTKTLADPTSPFAAELLEKLKSGSELDCPVCLGPTEDALIPPCGHLMCRMCAYHQIESNGNCPLCKRILTVTELKTVPRRMKCSVSSNAKMSSKVSALIEEIGKSEEKCVVFTQWVSMLDVLENVLVREEVRFVRLDGGMTRSQRTAALGKFEKGSEKVMIVTAGAGGTGLSLTSAHRVILLEPWWSPSREQQAIQRLHRIGQHHPVTAIRLVISDSIESSLSAFNSSPNRLYETPELSDLHYLLTPV